MILHFSLCIFSHKSTIFGTHCYHRRSPEVVLLVKYTEYRSQQTTVRIPSSRSKMYRSTLVSTLKVRSLSHIKHSYRGLRGYAQNKYGEGSKSSHTINNKHPFAVLAAAAVVGVGGYTIGKHWTVSVERRDAPACEATSGDRTKEDEKRDRKRHWKHWKSRRFNNNSNLNNAIKESTDLAQKIKVGFWGKY